MTQMQACSLDDAPLARCDDNTYSVAFPESELFVDVLLLYPVQVPRITSYVSLYGEDGTMWYGVFVGFAPDTLFKGGSKKVHAARIVVCFSD
jgi:hypothetical protein